MEKEETLLRKRLIELSNNAYQRGIIMYSDFLNLNELNILHTTPKDSFHTGPLAGMIRQSVRWQHFYLMLFICIWMRKVSAVHIRSAF